MIDAQSNSGTHKDFDSDKLSNHFRLDDISNDQNNFDK